jgi:uncharacterized membrane protein
MGSGLNAGAPGSGGTGEGSDYTNGGAGAATRHGSNGGGSRQGRASNVEGLANFLGWFSVGLGLAQITAPRRMARLVGASGDGKSEATMRALGFRELTAGVGILSQRRPAGWVWSRVAGDTMDLALLGRTLGSDRAERNRTTAATAAVLGITALDVYCARQLTASQRKGVDAAAGIGVRKSITVNRPPEEVYAFWRRFENLPRFMQHLESVETAADGRSHWKAKGPVGTSVEWDAEITEDRPNELIAWRSVENADVDNAGEVRFTRAAGGRGTEVHVDLRYDPPAGKLGALVAKLFGEEPNQQVADDLRRFKQVLETGEVVYSDASVHRGMHPAQPPAEPQAPRADREQQLVVERSADAAATTSSNRSRSSSTPRPTDRPASG